MDDIVTENTELSTEYEYIEEMTGSETTIPELDSIMSHVSEINSYMAVTAENIAGINAQTEVEVILMFVVIAFVGMACGLLVSNIIRK